MKKRVSLFKNDFFLALCLVIGLGMFGQSFFGKNNSKVLGDHSDNNNSGWWKSNKNSIPSVTSVATTTITATITTVVTKAVTNAVTVTPVITADPIVTDAPVLPSETVTQQQQQSGDVVPVKDVGVFNHPSLQTNNVQTQTIYSTEKVVEYVPVSQKSVTEENKTYYAPVKQSVFQTIQNKIQQVGRGEFVGTSTPSLTPAPTIKTPALKEEDPNVLSGDIDIFYRLQSGNVVLAAVNSENALLNIKEDDLRSAEVTLNKILDNKDVRLNVTSNNVFALVQEGVVVTTESPIHVNIDSHKIYLETSDGKKELKILPLEAIKEAVDLKSFEKLNKDSVPSVEKYGNELAYKVIGDKTYKVFGLFNVVTKQNVYITAETGEVIEGSQPLFTRIVSLISL